MKLQAEPVGLCYPPITINQLGLEKQEMSD